VIKYFKASDLQNRIEFPSGIKAVVCEQLQRCAWS